jgi:hypothetical protein
MCNKRTPKVLDLKTGKVLLISAKLNPKLSMVPGMLPVAVKLELLVVSRVCLVLESA